MRVETTRDYGRYFSTGIYHNFTENVNFHYLTVQIRGLGKLAVYWGRP